MDLRNVLVHMKGAAVKVGDTTYRIDADGVARDVARTDAAVLLRNREAWQVYTERKPVAAPEVPVPDVIIPAPAPAPEPQPPEESTEVPEATSAEAGAGGEGTGNGDAAEWPDPSEDLGIDYLREMATAHGVRFNNRTKPEKLVQRLRDEMFE